MIEQRAINELEKKSIRAWKTYQQHKISWKEATNFKVIETAVSFENDDYSDADGKNVLIDCSS